MKNILLIEDDENLGSLLTENLSPQYNLTLTTTIRQTYKELDNNHYDLVLIDRLLPDGDAIEIIEYIHQTAPSTKIIAISQLYQVHEKIKGLELGADDYLPKPFSFGELKLKVRKLLSLERVTESSELQLGELNFIPESGVIRIGSKTAKLRKKESRILECLFKYKNRVVSRQKLVDEVWSQQDSVPTQTTLDVYIRRIRISLQEYGSRIETKRGFGYILTDQ